MIPGLEYDPTVAAKWKITGQRQTTINNGQTYVPAMIVSFITGEGNAGNITVPHYDYTTDRVRGAVQNAADQVDEIANLRSEDWTNPGFLNTGS